MCLGVFFKVADNVFSNFKEHPKQYRQEALTGKAVIAAVCKESMACAQWELKLYCKATLEKQYAISAFKHSSTDSSTSEQ